MQQYEHPYLDTSTLLNLARDNGTPLYVYSKRSLEERARILMGLSLPYGHTVRYAVKANPHPGVIDIFLAAGLSFDASSSYEASALLEMGVPGEKISLSSQQPPHNLDELVEAGVQFVATSMHQLEVFGAGLASGSNIALRINPGFGSGHSNRVTTGGVNSSFGLWHEYVQDALELVNTHGLTINRLQVHIGAGADPSMWGRVIDLALEIVEKLPKVEVLDIGGGYKVHRYSDEHETDMTEIAAVFAKRIDGFAQRTGRTLHVEIEPGTWLVAHAGVLLSEVVDMVDTSVDGHEFLRLNTGMNDFLRSGMYGAQHEIAILTDAAEMCEYVVVGHNCETGDILTPAPGDPEDIEPRALRRAKIGDIVALFDAGAYCASMSTKGYNSFPSAKEILC